MTGVPVHYHGGPLSGQKATKPGSRWTLFRDDEGKPVSSPAGERAFRAGLGYTLTKNSQEGFYLHASDDSFPPWGCHAITG